VDSGQEERGHWIIFDPKCVLHREDLATSGTEKNAKEMMVKEGGNCRKKTPPPAKEGENTPCVENGCNKKNTGEPSTAREPNKKLNEGWREKDNPTNPF